MTALRDLRLRKAMDEAPDASLRPPERVRDAIREAAHGAVQPAWRRWWPRAGERRTPWLAAIATVLVASVIVLTWYGQEIPGARREAPQADQPAPAAAPPVQPAPPREAKKPDAVSKAKPPRTASPAAVAPDSAPTPSSDAGQAPAPAPAAEPPATSTPAAVPPAAPRMEAMPTPAPAARPAPPPLILPAPAPVAPAPARIAPAPQMQAAPSAAPRAAAPIAPATAWTSLRIEGDGRSVTLDRAGAAALPALIARLLSAQWEPADALAEPGALRIELLREGSELGVLELGAEGWRWRRDGRTQLLRPDAGTAQQAQAEAERLLAR